MQNSPYLDLPRRTHAEAIDDKRAKHGVTSLTDAELLTLLFAPIGPRNENKLTKAK